jgi:hypothetical protein
MQRWWMRIAQASEGKSDWMEEREGRDWRMWVEEVSRMVISWRICRMRVDWGGGRTGRERVRLESRISRRPRSPYIANKELRKERRGDDAVEVDKEFDSADASTKFGKLIAVRNVNMKSQEGYFVQLWNSCHRI